LTAASIIINDKKTDPHGVVAVADVITVAEVAAAFFSVEVYLADGDNVVPGFLFVNVVVSVSVFGLVAVLDVVVIFGLVFFAVH